MFPTYAKHKIIVPVFIVATDHKDGKTEKLLRHREETDL